MNTPATQFHRPVRARTLVAALVVLACSAWLTPAIAEQGASSPSESRWRVRARMIGIMPDDSSDNITLGPAKAPLGAGVSVDSAAMPELDLTYMITPHIGIEAIASMANHDVHIDGSDALLNTLGVVDDLKIFDAWVLPPTVTLQYHFKPDAKLRPYVGVGANYTAFLWNDATERLENTVGPVSVDTSSSWGWAAQFGFDWEFREQWFVNFDVKYIDIDTTASLFLKNVGAGVRVDVDVDPWVVGAGIGYRF